MICNDILTTNLKLLKDTSEYFGIRMVPSDITQMLSRVIITFKLSNVRIFELIALQQLATEVSIISESDYEDTDIKELLDYTGARMHKNFMEISTSWIKEIAYLTHSSKKSLLAPVGECRMEVQATFKEGALIRLCRYSPYQIFKIHDKSMSLEENIQNNLTKMLIETTMEHSKSEINHEELTIPNWLKSNVYDKNNDPYMVSTIYGDNGAIIRFLDNTVDGLKSQIKAARENLSAYTHWYAEINCNTPLMVFLFYKTQLFVKNAKIRISDHLPYKWLECDCDYSRKEVFGSDEKFRKELLRSSTMGNTLYEFLKKYSGWFKDNVVKSNVSFLGVLNWLPNWVSIPYTITLDISTPRYMVDIRRTLNDYDSMDPIIKSAISDLWDQISVASGFIDKYNLH